jgi:hypothetical protein
MSTSCLVVANVHGEGMLRRRDARARRAETLGINGPTSSCRSRRSPGAAGGATDGVDLLIALRQALRCRPDERRAFVDRALHALGIGSCDPRRPSTTTRCERIVPARVAPTIYMVHADATRDGFGGDGDRDFEDPIARRCASLLRRAKNGGVLDPTSTTSTGSFRLGSDRRASRTRRRQPRASTGLISPKRGCVLRPRVRIVVLVVAEKEEQSTICRSRSMAWTRCVTTDSIIRRGSLRRSERGVLLQHEGETRRSCLSAIKWGLPLPGLYSPGEVNVAGTPRTRSRSKSLVLYLQNHDQVAKLRARQAAPRAHEPGKFPRAHIPFLPRAATPMIFQGQGIRPPRAPLFANHEPELAKLVAKGPAVHRAVPS